ncbi:Holliday junction branch migration protein RuvA [Roseicitreum antarcticum]|uniref:Holliday junction branch migration complex subunit RuvA n=1 Tax=Roseicitreum antarcticum TaxID=564137 RepID=A0A1H2RCV8_9RHOB|nr:Holliday junction branch migration protein RuvA [Roseicitreum antarcticum]SDW17000.1 Holliday junction DNA helicase subunit RuvA [Roseicitreum antarcticum]
MIGRVAGRLDYRGSDHVLIDVGGVGYIVYVSDRTLMGLPGPGGACALYTDLVVREDLLQLYGFPTLLEKEWHRLLTSVQGVGAKASMAILSTLGADGVSRAIALGDAGSVRAAPGVGPKLAQRVVMELKDKAPALMAMGHAAPRPAPAAPAPGDDAVIEVAAPPPLPSSHSAEAMSALTNLGYAPPDASRAVAEAMDADPALDTAGLIRAALRLLAPKG